MTRTANTLSGGTDIDEIRAWFPEFPLKVVLAKLRKVHRLVYPNFYPNLRRRPVPPPLETTDAPPFEKATFIPRVQQRRD